MLDLQARIQFVRLCWGRARHHTIWAVLGAAMFLYSFLQTIAPLVDLSPLNFLADKFPKLPLPWGIATTFFLFALMLIDGGYALRNAELAGLRFQAINKAEFSKQIEILTGHIQHGNLLMHRCRTEKELVPQADATAWAASAEVSIEEIFNRTYITRFRSSTGVPMGAVYWPNLENRQIDGFAYVRVYRLQGFVDELQAKLDSVALNNSPNAQM
jgi:hypothetical protein